VADILDTDDAIGGFSFEGRKVLRGSDEIKEHFPEPLAEKTIHLAIKGKQHSFILSTHIG
jgi:hypothetical protein